MAQIEASHSSCRLHQRLNFNTTFWLRATLDSVISVHPIPFVSHGKTILRWWHILCIAVLRCTYCVIKYSELHSHKFQFNLNLNQFRGIEHSQSGDCVVANKTQSIRTVPWFEFHSEKENKTNSKRIRFNCVTLFSLVVCVSFILIFFNIKPYFCARYSEVYCRKKKSVYIFLEY